MPIRPICGASSGILDFLTRWFEYCPSTPLDNLYVIVGDAKGSKKYTSEQAYKVEKLELAPGWLATTPNINDVALARLAGSNIGFTGPFVGNLSFAAVTNNADQVGAPVLVAGFGNTVNTCELTFGKSMYNTFNCWMVNF